MKQGILLIGYGNPGRQDDGLGPQFIQTLEECSDLNENISLSSNYQLTVEDAYDIVGYESVVFVDASIDAPPPFTFSTLTANDQHSLGSHQLHPESVMQLCQTLYDSQPKAYLLAIRGYEFDKFEEALSLAAQSNLNEALKFTQDWIENHA